MTSARAALIADPVGEIAGAQCCGLDMKGVYVVSCGTGLKGAKGGGIYQAAVTTRQAQKAGTATPGLLACAGAGCAPDDLFDNALTLQIYS